MKFKGPGEWLTQAKKAQAPAKAVERSQTVHEVIQELADWLKRWGDSWKTQDRAPNGQFGTGEGSTKTPTPSEGSFNVEKFQTAHSGGSFADKLASSGNAEAEKQFTAANFHSETLTTAEHDAMTAYEKGPYQEINGVLRGNLGGMDKSDAMSMVTNDVDHFLTKGTASGFEGSGPSHGGGMEPQGAKLFDNMDSAIEKSTVSSNVVTFRGVTPDVLSQMQEGGTFTDHAYVSTSLRTSETVGGGATLEVHIEAGSHALSMVSSGVNPTDTMHESEILLPRGSQFHVDSIEANDLTGYHAVLTYMGTTEGLGSGGKLTRAQKRLPVHHMNEEGEAPSSKFVWQKGDLDFHDEPQKRSQTPLARLKRKHTEKDPLV